MALRCASVLTLFGSAAALKALQPFNPDSWIVPGVVNITDPATSRLAPSAIDMDSSQYSELRYGPPQLESEICQVQSDRESMEQHIIEKATSKNPLNWVDEMNEMSAWKQHDPPAFPSAGIGARRIMYAIDGMSYQLFLPVGWKNFTKRPYPVVVYLHGHPERKWSVMNAGGFTRLLARNQSTSFTKLSCWCVNASKFNTEVYADTEDTSVNTATMTAGTGPMANCTFADTFPGLAIIPQGWTGPTMGSWTAAKLDKVKNITKFIMQHYNGNPDKVIMAGYAEGAKGAVDMVKSYPTLYAGLIMADQKGVTTDMTNIESMPTLVSGDAADGLASTDAIVSALKGRTSGVSITKYMRYAESPPSDEPMFADAYKHTADLMFRDTATWSWAFSQSLTPYSGRSLWELPGHDFIHLDSPLA